MAAENDSAVSLLLRPEQRDALDQIARLTDRDRNTILNDAVETYLDIHRKQAEHIREGLRQADASEFASEDEVAAAFSDLR